MALVKGTTTLASPTPGAPTTSATHYQEAGDDGYLMISVQVESGSTFSSCTYDGVAMTLVDTIIDTINGSTWALYGLASPSTGTNTVVITFGNSVWQPIGAYIQSFTGCGGIDNTSTTLSNLSPNTQSLTLAANSMLYSCGISLHAVVSIKIDSVSKAFTHQITANRQFTGVLTSSQTAGSHESSIIMGSTSYSISNFMVEITEAGGTPPTRRRRIIIV